MEVFHNSDMSWISLRLLRRGASLNAAAAAAFGIITNASGEPSLCTCMQQRSPASFRSTPWLTCLDEQVYIASHRNSRNTHRNRFAESTKDEADCQARLLCRHSALMRAQSSTAQPATASSSVCFIDMELKRSDEGRRLAFCRHSVLLSIEPTNAVGWTAAAVRL